MTDIFPNNPDVEKDLYNGLCCIINQYGVTEGIIEELKTNDFIIYKSILGKIKLVSPRSYKAAISGLTNPSLGVINLVKDQKLTVANALAHLQNPENYLPINSDNLRAWAKEYNV